MIKEIIIGKVYKSTFDNKFRRVDSIHGNNVFFFFFFHIKCKTGSRMPVDKPWFLRNHSELDQLSDIEKLTARVEKLEELMGV